MISYKCKMCGGTLEFESGATVGVCEYCGSKQTLPKLDDDRRANLYDRANHFRRNNDFDKASGIYEQILNEDSTDAEAYWSLVLCRYGIEYVEDPVMHKRIPTVNRAQFTSIFDDDNYKSALQYADINQRSIYEEEANNINEIQKGILAISQKEEPFDVFICYKETDSNGRRTPDSVLANDLYHQLTQEGFKVFFSRITLEDKLGTAYEPYIFAALNSAKVMVVLGTKSEYFNAVWVKNEWSRYPALVKTSGGKKMLIPAYKDMDPYDLPEEFSHLQAQDMSKLGFMQDLIRGIKKILGENVISKSSYAEQPSQVITPAVVTGGANVSSLLKRAYIFLEDRNWDEADAYCEKVLDIEPENADAYLCKLLAENKLRSKGLITTLREPLDDNGNFQKVIRYGNEALKTELKRYNNEIISLIEHDRLSSIYNKAKSIMESATSEEQFKSAAGLFQSIQDFENAEMLYKKCIEKAEDSRKDDIYVQGLRKLQSSNETELRGAIKLFNSIPDWKDSDKKVLEGQERITEICQEKERLLKEEQLAIEKKKKQKRNRIIVMVIGSLAATIVVVLILLVIIPHQKYKHAMDLIQSGSYNEAYSILEELNKQEEIIDNKYDRAISLINSENYDNAYLLLDEIGYNDVINQNKIDRAKHYFQIQNLKDAYSILNTIDQGECNNRARYDIAESLISEKDYKTAYELLEDIDSNYSIEKRILCLKSMFSESVVGDIIKLGVYEQDNDKSNGVENIEWIILEKNEDKMLIISKKSLEYKMYNNSEIPVNWENSALRKWLNEDFLSTAFKQDEQNIIIDKPSNNAILKDKNRVSLLSSKEVIKFFPLKEDRKDYANKYARALAGLDSISVIQWWLRPDDDEKEGEIYVSTSGDIIWTNEKKVGKNKRMVRPVIWIDIEI